MAACANPMCGHSSDTHSHDDSDNHAATDQDCPFRCNECDCTNFVAYPKQDFKTLEEIDEQRRLGWPDFHPEDYCHRCGGRNPSWFIDSDRFNLAFGPPDKHPYNGIVCPGCFVLAHEEASGMRTTWKLVPSSHTPFRWIGDPED